jgi:hypothetical protein
MITDVLMKFEGRILMDGRGIKKIMKILCVKEKNGQVVGFGL